MPKLYRREFDMSRKILLGLTVVSLLTVAWIYQNQQSSAIVSTTPGDTRSSVSNGTNNISSNNSLVLESKSEVTEGEIFAQSGDLDLEYLKNNSVDSNDESLEKKRVTYTNSDGQLVEITVISGANVTDVVPLN